MLKNDERSQYVYENKGRSDTMPEKKSDIYVEKSDILVNWAALAHQMLLPGRHFVSFALPYTGLNAFPSGAAFCAEFEGHAGLFPATGRADSADRRLCGLRFFCPSVGIKGDQKH